MILVTGGAGHIGSHCILELIKKGYEVIAFDNLSTGKIETIHELSSSGMKGFIEGDLLNNEQVWNAFGGNKIEAVIHCAEISQDCEEKNKVRKLYHNNVVGTLNLLDAMDRFHVNKIVFSSSTSTFDNKKVNSINLPLDTYSHTKLMCERMLNNYNDNPYCINYAILKYFKNANENSTYIEDVANAHVLAFEYLNGGGKSGHFSIGINEGKL